MARSTGSSFLDQFQGKPLPRVFISFRGEELRNTFVSHLVRALRDAGVNVFIDSHEQRGRNLRVLLRRIETSKVALVIFSERYAEKEWPLNELVKIAESVRERNLVAIPVFYKVSTEDVKMVQGKFVDYFMETLERAGGEDNPLCQLWMDSVSYISGMIGLTSQVHSIDDNLVEEIVKAIKRQLPYQSPAKRALQREFAREYIIAASTALICSYVIPTLFKDASFFISLEWFKAVLVLFIVRQIFNFLEICIP